MVRNNTLTVGGEFPFRPPLVLLLGLDPETCRRIQALAAARQLPVRFVDSNDPVGARFADMALAPRTSTSIGSLNGALRAILAGSRLRPGEHATIGKWHVVRLATHVHSQTSGFQYDLRYLLMPDGSYAFVAGPVEWRTWSTKLARRVLRWLQTTEFEEALLIVGPTGTGKTLLAKLTHEVTARPGGKLVRIGNEVLSGDLLQAELFGTTKGAYTGATRERPGLVELAEGGTLLLDELDAVPPLAQASLCRFLDGHDFERIGSDDTRTVLCTIIACCNRPLGSLLDLERLAIRLYQRLAGKKLTIPPLRKRKEDIVGFASYELARLAIRTGRRCRFTNRALTYLLSVRWDGNVRELIRVVRTLWSLKTSGVIDLSDVLAVVPGGRLSEAVKQAAQDGRSLPEVNKLVNRFLIVRALIVNNGNVSAAARQLAIRRDTFYAKARQCGIDIPKLRKMLGEEGAKGGTPKRKNKGARRETSSGPDKPPRKGKSQNARSKKRKGQPKSQSTDSQKRSKQDRKKRNRKKGKRNKGDS